MEDKFERLAGRGIEVAPMPGIKGYALCARGEYGALVAVSEAGFGAIGSTGLITPRGLAVLVWRGETAVFAAKGAEAPASAEQVEALRSFASDLREALLG